MPDKIPVVVPTIGVRKSFDKKLNKPAVELAQKLLSKAIGKSSKLDVVTKVKKDVKGFEVSATITEITFDEKKGTLTVKIEIIMAMLPGPKIFATTANGASADKVKPDKLEASLSDIIDPLCEALGAKAAKALEGRIGGF